MVSETYHEFFLATAGVAGALIGLLFVAVSVRPDEVGERGAATVRFRPAASLSAFLNALLASLLMLIPFTSPGAAVIVLAVTGMVTMLTLTAAVLVGWRREGAGLAVRSLITILGQLALYVGQLTLGLRLDRNPSATGPATALCIVIIVLFVVGIERAWEFVGAETPGPLAMMVRALRGARRPTTTPANPEATSGPEV